MNNSEKKNNNGRLLVLGLLAITAVAVGITLWALFFRTPQTTAPLAPDYAPQEKEEQAEPIVGEDPDEKLDKPQGGGSVSLTYSKDVTIDLSDKTVSLLFANPGKSTQDMVLQVIIQDTLIVQSGLLTPGNQVNKLTLADDAAGQLSEGGYEGKFVLSYYDPDSGEKAIVNTEIPVNITVNP